MAEPEPGTRDHGTLEDLLEVERRVTALEERLYRYAAGASDESAREHERLYLRCSSRLGDIRDRIAFVRDDFRRGVES